MHAYVPVCRSGFLAILFFLACTLLAAPAAHAVVTLDQDYDSGSLNVASSTVNMADPLRPAVWLVMREGYFQFRIHGVQGLTPQFSVADGTYMTSTHRFWYSYDNRNWILFNNGTASGGTYRFSNNAPFTQDTVYVAEMLPFPTWRTDELVAFAKTSPYVTPTASADANMVIGYTLGTAGGGQVDDYGRPVPALPLYGFKITDPNTAGPKVKVELQSGNHPCEYSGSWVHEGLVLFLLGNDPRAAVLRQKVEFYVYPLVNPEGRYAGMGWNSPQVLGMNHNRIWHDPYGYGDTAAQIVEAAAKNDTGSRNVEYIFDFHSWTSATTLEISIRYNVVGTTFINTMLALEPGLTLPKYDNGEGFADTWAVSAEGLGATYGLIPEFGILAGVDPNGYHNYGSHYGIALYESLKNHLEGDLAPVVNVGADRWIVAPTNQVSLAGTVSDDGLPAAAPLSYTWTKGTGPGTVTFSSPNALNTTATFSTYGTYRLSLNASDTDINGHDDLRVVYSAAPVNHWPAVSAGPDASINAPANSVSLAGSVSDDGLPASAAVTATWIKTAGPGTVTFANAGAAATSATFSMPGTYLLRLTGRDTALTSYDEIRVIYSGAAGNQAPAVNAGPDQAITLPVNQVSLAGTLSDDGLPPGGAVSGAWTLASGPGTVTFANANALATTATFSTTGTYVLRLTAGDTALTSQDDVQITVNPAPVNQAPAVNAGADQAIALPVDQVSLAGTISDDGLPPGGAVSWGWTVASGPGTVTFANPDALATTVTFSTAGTYVLRLTAGDTALMSQDDVQITVNPAPVNQAPAVNAGPDRAIALPATSLSLAGSVSDDGLPPGAAVTAAWSLVSGPGAVAFADANAAATSATFSTLGTYVLRLTAGDTALQASDECTVTVYETMGGLPYGGTPWPLPGRVEGEDYDLGGQTVAYYDTTAGNIGGEHRSDDVDIRATTDVGGGYVIKNIATGEWLTYTISVPSTGSYDLRVRTAAGPNTGRYLHLELDGNDLTGRIDIPSTANYDTGSTTTASNCLLPAGIHVLGVYFDTGDFNFNWFEAALVNAAPTANAGLDAMAMMPNAAALAGSISDDGQPAPPAACTAAWSVVAGPGTVTFASPSAAATTATFSTAGTYVLRLAAGDSAFSATHDVTVTVLGAGDFTGDGRVDGLDFLNWQSHYPNLVGGATPDGGDGNGDGKVDGLDFLVWQANYQP